MKSLVLTVALAVVGVLTLAGAVAVLVGGGGVVAASWLVVGAMAAAAGSLCGLAVADYRQRGGTRRTERA